MKIIRATAQHLSPTAALFDQYRMFYEQPGDLPGATAFIEANLAHDRSQIFLLLDDDERAVAFAQLYPTWCSTAMKPFMYLSDLRAGQGLPHLPPGVVTAGRAPARSA
jgi:hypothetical protein